MANRTSKGCFVKGHSGNPAGRPKNPPEFAPNTDDPDGAGRRTVGNLVIEARKFSGLAVDTLVELTKDNYAPSTRFVAATALLDRGYGRPAQSLDLHLSADAITKRLSDMTDAELAALEQRMIAAAPIVLEATAEVSDDAVAPDGDAEDSPPDVRCLTRRWLRIETAHQYSTHHGPSRVKRGPWTIRHSLDLGRGEVLAPPKLGVLRPAGATARFSMAGVTSRSFDFTGILASH